MANLRIRKTYAEVFASRYMTYIPSEDEFKKELRLENYHKKDDE